MKSSRSINIKLDEAGFTIVELLVAVGIMGVVAMGLLNLTHFFQKESRSSLLRSEIYYFDRKISHILANAKNCEATIKSTDPVIPLRGTTGKANLSFIRTAAQDGITEDPIIYEVDTTFDPNKRLDKELSETLKGGVSSVWIKRITIKEFQETDFVEADTAMADVTSPGYNSGVNKYGWAVIEVYFAVRQLNGTVDGDGVQAKYFTRTVKGEYPVAIEVTPGRQLVRCVDASIRSSHSAIESLCVDLGGSVTFNDGQPECYGTMDKTLQIGRRTLCADFGGHTRSKEETEGNSGEINVKNYDCVQQPLVYECDGTRLMNSESLEFSCAPNAEP